jgi:DNA-directed RNA polymerase specialized sigma24 family protein
LALWTEFHEGVAALPDNERILFDLLWYQNMTLGEAATILGEPERTVRRRWRALRIRFARQFDEDSA